MLPRLHDAVRSKRKRQCQAGPGPAVGFGTGAFGMVSKSSG